MTEPHVENAFCPFSAMNVRVIVNSREQKHCCKILRLGPAIVRKASEASGGWAERACAFSLGDVTPRPGGGWLLPVFLNEEAAAGNVEELVPTGAACGAGT